MRFLLRFIFPLILILGLLAYALIPLVDTLTTNWFIRDLDIRSQLIATTIHDDLSRLLSLNERKSREQALQILRKTTQDVRLLAMGVCSPSDELILHTELLPPVVACSAVRDLAPHVGKRIQLESGDIHVAYGHLTATGADGAGSERLLGKILMLHDMSFAARRSNDTKLYLFRVFLAIGALIALITVVVAQWSRADWIKTVRDLVSGMRSGRTSRKIERNSREFAPILKDLKVLVRELEASSREDELSMIWNAKAIKNILHQELSGDEIIVVANRQPYIHVKKGATIEVQSPASGLVTAIEPILKACSGIWIAHGSGSADRQVVDQNDKVRVPPDNPQYEIHRVWLNKDEERGFYYGFANEGLWPLCHIAHTRPVFRLSDWEQYLAVNSKFVDSIVQDAKTDNPVVLVQDYHFALVPKLLRERMPNAVILTFWHIPWPNPESFGICPWREEILEGLLSSSIVGFHTQFHCNNFIDCIDRFLESRIDRETNCISYQGRLTEVRPYPISIEWPPSRLAKVPSVDACRTIVREQNHFTPDLRLGVGIDRLDYTKGIIERFRAIERLLEIEPGWGGKFSFVQISAPSRSSIEAYQQFESEVRAVAQVINSRFGVDGYQPIVLRVMHHEPERVFEHLRAADLCLVSSLHDGMNLVAKEFVAARDDEQGVLILSMFAGASRELAQALIVNPYDADQTARALHAALTMESSEQRERMRAMRYLVKENNVFKWAGRMLLDAARMRRRDRFEKRVTDWSEVIEHHKRLSGSASSIPPNFAASKQPSRLTSI